MSRSKEHFAGGLLVILLLYVSGYIGYRQYGRIGVYHPPDGGAPVVLVRDDSPASVALFHLFQPCIEIERCHLVVQHGRRN